MGSLSFNDVVACCLTEDINILKTISLTYVYLTKGEGRRTREGDNEQHVKRTIRIDLNWHNVNISSYAELRARSSELIDEPCGWNIIWLALVVAWLLLQNWEICAAVGTRQGR
jgi:hypothetical protein